MMKMAFSLCVLPPKTCHPRLTIKNNMAKPKLKSKNTQPIPLNTFKVIKNKENLRNVTEYPKCSVDTPAGSYLTNGYLKPVFT